MLHLRVVPPAGHTGDVLRVLADDVGVTNVLRFEGAAVSPAGDVIEADVAREAADAVIDRLRDVCLEHGGSLSMQELDLSLGEAGERAEAAAPGRGIDAVVWEEVAQRTSEDATLSTTFLTFLVVATLIASVGLLTDSSVLIVGAMVLGPEFGPLAATAVALVQRRPDAAWRSLRALVVGFPIAIVVTAGAVALLAATLGVPEAYRSGHRPLTSFVSHPDVFSVVVALLAGTAGVVSLTASKSSAIVGVFISVTTIPAAANIGTAVVTGHADEAVGAAVQLVINLACILLAAVGTLLVQRVAWRRRLARGDAASRGGAGPTRRS